MAVDTTNLDRYVRQAIETWETTAKHDLGFSTVDRTTGKRYLYVTHDDGGATAATAANGVPCGPYAGAGDGNGSTTVTTVTPDATEAINHPTGVYRGAPTTGQFGFIEVKDPAIPTTVKVDCSDVIIQGTYLQWSTDGELDSVAYATCTSAELALVVGVSLDSTVDSTYPAIQWL